MRRLVVLLLCAAGLGVLAAPADQDRGGPQATFRTGVDIVDVDVSVLDRNRLPVRGLSSADFTVLEDGRPRPVVAFTAAELPLKTRVPAKWMDDVPADVLGNDVSREGRLVVILMDRSIAPELLPTAVQYAEAAVNQLRPGDLAAVAYSTFGIPQNFTSDRRRLLAAIRQPVVGLPEGDDGSPAECFCGTCSLESIGNIAEALLPAKRSVMAALVRRGNLDVLPAHTGGRLVLDPTRAADRVAEVFRESDAYYVLGFQPAHPGDRSRFHDIRVKVNRPDVTVQARRGYYSTGTLTDTVARRSAPLPAGVSAGLQAAISGLWPRTGLALEMNVVPVATPNLQAATVAVLLHVRQPLNPADLALVGASPATGASSLVNVLAGAFDRGGRELASANQTLMVRPRRVGAGLPELEYEVVTRLRLRPGRYEIRAAVEDATQGQTGSVYGYVDVPDYQHAPVALSGLLVDAEPARLSVPSMALGDLVPFTPTARRVFVKTDRVTGFVRIYQGLARAMMPGYVVAEIRDDQDQSVFHQESRVLPNQFGDSRAMDFSVDVPIDHLRHGEYLLSVEARHGNETARRDARFKVD